MAIAPTVSNSKLSGNISPGIEPWAANIFTEQTAKGTFIRKNNELERVLRKLGINNKDTWEQILADGGSVQGIDELDNWGYLNNTLLTNSSLVISLNNLFPFLITKYCFLKLKGQLTQSLTDVCLLRSAYWI
jgi:hypothetical protein